jgi:hypothetical protein
MTAMLIPLALNELLDRPLIVSFNVVLVFPASLLKPHLSCLREVCLTPELTRRAFNAGADKLTMKIKLTRAPVE